MKQTITLLIFILAMNVTANAFSTNLFPGDDDDSHFNLGGAKKGLIIMPNAATGDVHLYFVSRKATEAVIKVIDATGKVVLTQKSELKVGKNKVNINDFKQLQDGNYTIQLVAANKLYNSSFIVWK